ncbi:uncharacterized protein FIBRA_08392 [Fibroporia radiculosa]|uniref:AB hydrolase-1 domain-containing protein n=1 Tax=Fibroporia radiculosa TaxID=599839 RepID=J4I2N4_9APHY|nr:uncharacterized protein FIBRA_08392 [Fibroporia radiculosa]CCM06142.1 predicted protein [Fibroporia radiculosa]
MENMKENAGLIPFHYKGETYHTWYKIVGDLHSGATPLVTLHGGPGVSHHYMLPHTDLVALHKIPVIFYDQIGIGASTHLRNKPAEFWTPELWMDELENLLAYLGIQDAFDIVGNSWGGMLGGQFAGVRRPPGLKHLVVANAGASMELWQIGTKQLLERLEPEEVRETIKKHEREGTAGSEEWRKAMEVYNRKHICKVVPWPEELLMSFASGDEDPTVYATTIGPSEFNIVGTFKHWSIVDVVGNITVPTLLINARDDSAQDIGLIPFFEKVARVKWIQFAHSSHTPLFEERERYMEILGNFLTKTV